jgi:hypothetical protein
MPSLGWEMRQLSLLGMDVKQEPRGSRDGLEWGDIHPGPVTFPMSGPSDLSGRH